MAPFHSYSIQPPPFLSRPLLAAISKSLSKCSALGTETEHDCSSWISGWCNGNIFIKNQFHPDFFSREVCKYIIKSNLLRALSLDCFVYSTFFRWIHNLVENLYKKVSGNFVSFHSLSEKIDKKLFALFFVCFLFQSPWKRFIIQKLNSKKINKNKK